MLKTNQGVESYFEGFGKFQNPVADDYKVVEVTIDPLGGGLANYVGALFAEFEFAVSSKGGSLDFTENDLLIYCESLIANRVCWVRKIKFGGGQPLHARDNSVIVPSLISLLIAQIGDTSDSTLGVELQPVLPEDYEFKMTADDMISFGRKLKKFGNQGFVYAQGYYAGRDGSWDFMTFVAIEDTVRNHSAASHPSFSVLASIVTLKRAEVLWEPRVNYGNLGMFSRWLSQAAEFKHA